MRKQFRGFLLSSKSFYFFNRENFLLINIAAGDFSELISVHILQTRRVRQVATKSFTSDTRFKLLKLVGDLESSFEAIRSSELISQLRLFANLSIVSSGSLDSFFLIVPSSSKFPKFFFRFSIFNDCLTISKVSGPDTRSDGLSQLDCNCSISRFLFGDCIIMSIDFLPLSMFFPNNR